MARKYWPASLFAWTPPTVMRHHDFLLFCFISRDKNGPFLVNYAIQAATEKTHKCHVSTPWMDNFSLIRRHLGLTAGVQDLIE